MTQLNLFDPHRNEITAPYSEPTTSREAAEQIQLSLGVRVGYLTLVGQPTEGTWECLCRCGVVRVLKRSSLLKGHHKSCGCSKGELCSRSSQRAKTHGHRCGGPSPTYKAWGSMKERCLKPSHKSYHHYGERGITICDRWIESFENFLEDMGERPSTRHSIDRIDNDGNYEPGNCRWATAKQQQRNKRDNRLVTAFGETKTLCEWCDDSRCSIERDTLSWRLRNGWEPEVAISKPGRRQKNSRNKNAEADSESNLHP